MNTKIILIAILIIIISAIHLSYTGNQSGFHILHQQLFYIPLVLASFWFGTKPGILVAVIISLFYGPAMILRHTKEEMHLLVYAQIALYLFVAIMMGWLSDRRKKQQDLLLKGERITAIGRAASAVSFEILDIIKSISKTYQRSGGLKKSSANDDFFMEVSRLRKLVEALGRFAPSMDHLTLSTDLNDILQHSYTKFKNEAAGKGLRLILQPDPEGCPSMLPRGEITRIYDSLVSNSIDFSHRGQSIILRSKKGGEACKLQVIDFGPGVTQENEKKLFSIFFTTKEDGYGLSLSSGRKVMRNFGGDVTYESGEEKGAIFSIIVPRENTAAPIEEIGQKI
jgi:signal transduction histidine kinase